MVANMWMGIDPGQTGGLACIGSNNLITALYPFDDLSPWEIHKKMSDIKKAWPGVKACIEAVGAFPGQGVHSMFVFGQNYGMLQGFLIALEIPFEKVSPVTWKKAVGLARKTGLTSRKERKFLSRSMAQRLFPKNIDIINDSTAEALLIARYYKAIEGRAGFKSVVFSNEPK